jgi:hypothetical protein
LGLDGGRAQSARHPGLLEHWKQFPEVEVDLFRYHPDDVEKMRGKAVRQLRKLLIERHTQFISNLADADAALEDANKEMDALERQGRVVMDHERRAAVGEHVNALRKEIREAGLALNAAASAAAQFDATDDVSDLLAGLRESVRARGLAFNARMRAMQRKQVALPK